MRYQLTIGLVGAVLLAGCGSAEDFELIDVSGTVNFRGTPIEDGAVLFVSPRAATPSSGPAIPARAAQIKQGKYDASGSGGVAPGTYKIEIEAYTKNAAVSADAAQDAGGAVPEAMIVRKQVLPEKYNKKSDMTLTVESGSDPIVKNFDLKE